MIGDWIVGGSLGPNTAVARTVSSSFGPTLERQKSKKLVKKGTHKETGQHAALSIINKHEADQITMQHLKRQVAIMKQMNHINVSRCLEFNKHAIFETEDGDKLEVVLIAIELYRSGEVFNFLYGSFFEESMTRTYFHQLIEGVEHIHSKLVVHLNIKPENLLLDKEFVLKITHFDSAKQLESKHAKLRDRLRTSGYSAPEIMIGTPYSMNVDIFACGVILFICLAGFPPFKKATRGDMWFNKLIMKEYDLFWEEHCQSAHFSDAVTDLLIKMLDPNPYTRITIADIKKHVWYNGRTISQENLMRKLTSRRKSIQMDDEQKHPHHVDDKVLFHDLSQNIETTVDLNGAGIGDSEVLEISELLKVNTACKELMLGNNNITDEGAAHIASALKENSFLASLFVNGNKIGPVGILQIADAVKRRQTYLKINLSSQRLSATSKLTYLYYRTPEDVHEIGSGNFGTVYRATICSKEGRKECVIKVAHDEKSTDALYETLVLQALPEHDHVLKLIGIKNNFTFGPYKNASGLVVELHKGGSVKQFIEHNEGPVSISQCLDFAKGMALGIQHLHHHNLLHRDIALRNFVLSDELQPILIDFGLSCTIREDAFVVPLPHELFPIQICAPESLQAPYRFTKSSDIWMLGVAIWQLFHIDNGIPFLGIQGSQKLRAHLKTRHLNGYTQFLVYRSRNIKTELKDLIQSCCQYDYDNRPQIGEVVEFIDTTRGEIPKELAEGCRPDMSKVDVPDEYGDDGRNQADFEIERYSSYVVGTCDSVPFEEMIYVSYSGIIYENTAEYFELK